MEIRFQCSRTLQVGLLPEFNGIKKREAKARIQEQTESSQGSSNSKQVSLKVIFERQQKKAFDHPSSKFKYG